MYILYIDYDINSSNLYIDMYHIYELCLIGYSRITIEYKGILKCILLMYILCNRDNPLERG
jgi:hypothetical protein